MNCLTRVQVEELGWSEFSQSAADCHFTRDAQFVLCILTHEEAERQQEAASLWDEPAGNQTHNLPVLRQTLY